METACVVVSILNRFAKMLFSILDNFFDGSGASVCFFDVRPVNLFSRYPNERRRGVIVNSNKNVGRNEREKKNSVKLIMLNLIANKQRFNVTTL